MKKYKLNILTFLLLIPIFAIGQIPKGHFLDADKTAERGYKAKPFKQEKEGIYHYAVLTELPFENDCDSGLSEKEQIACSEKNLRNFIYPKLSSDIKFKGNVYVYLTVTEDSKVTDVTVSSYPNSESTKNLIKEALNSIEFRPGKFENEIVKSRLWTSFTFPSSSNELFSVSLAKMQKDKKRVDEIIKSTVPMKRFSTLQEIANSVVFLCSDRASFITGATLVIDGGQTVGLP